MPINRVFSIRTNISANHALPLYKFRFKKNGTDIFYLNSKNGKFEAFSNKTKIMGSATDCIFSINEGNEYKIVSVEASHFARFSVAFAVYQKGVWRLRFRSVTTNNDGLLIFKMHSTIICNDGKFVVPPSCGTRD